MSLHRAPVRAPQGEEVLREIRRRHHGLPVILMSGYADGAADHLSSLSPTGFLSKPFDLEQLEQLLQAAAQPRDTPTASGALRVLVADDDPQVLEAACAILEQLGHRALLARDGEEALEIYRRAGDTIDVLILDQLMPGLDGAATWLAIRELDPAAVALFACGNVGSATSRRLLEHGVTGLLPKPFTADSVQRALQEALSRRRAAEP